MGITSLTGYHFRPSTRNDIITLADRHNTDDIFTFHPGRTQSFQVKDVLAIGIEKLGQTSLIKDFLARTEGPLDPEVVDVEGTFDDGMEELDDLGFDEFEGPNDLLR